MTPESLAVDAARKKILQGLRGLYSRHVVMLANVGKSTFRAALIPEKSAGVDGIALINGTHVGGEIKSNNSVWFKPGELASYIAEWHDIRV